MKHKVLIMGSASIMIMLLVMAFSVLAADSVGFYAVDPDDVPPVPIADQVDLDQPGGAIVDIGAEGVAGYWVSLPLVTAPPRLGLGEPEWLFYERLDDDWGNWRVTDDGKNCTENCDEWRWNKSHTNPDYDGDADARINCYKESPDLLDMASEYSCDSELYSVSFDASACSGVLLSIDEQYHFDMDDHNSDYCSRSYGTIYVDNSDYTYNYVHRHSASSGSGSYLIGEIYDISKWAAGDSRVSITFDAYGFLGGYKGVDDACWPQDYFFKTFWRIDDVKVRCLKARPDGTIAPLGGVDVGRGIYNSNGAEQTVAVRADLDETAIFHVRWWNDGSYDSDDIVISGPAAATGWTVRYYDGTTDITSEVTGTGWPAKISSGGYEIIRVEIKQYSATSPSSIYEALISGTSTQDPSKMDAVKAVVAVGTEKLSVEIGSINEGALGHVTSNPAGIDCPDSCQADFTVGTEVTLTAVADAGYAFNYWYPGSYGTEPHTKVTIDEDKTIKAYFSKPVIVTPEAGPGGSITPSEPTAVLVGSQTFWKVVPDAGYQIADVSITHGVGCRIFATDDPTIYRLLVDDNPYEYECTLSATFESQ